MAHFTVAVFIASIRTILKGSGEEGGCYIINVGDNTINCDNMNICGEQSL